MMCHPFLAVLLAGAVHGAVVPTAPGPGMSFTEGSDCSLSWQLDTTGKWTSFSVDLMSGSNTAMNVVQNVFKDRDGTKGPTSYSFKCPKVSPYSAIYFYQFTQAGADTAWTTRFTIKDSSGQSTPPANPTQPDGKAIPWGIGAVAGASSATPASGGNTTASSVTASPVAGNMTVLTTPPTTANATASTTSTSSPATAADAVMVPTSNSSSTAPTQITSSSADPVKKNTSASSGSSTTGTTVTGSTASSTAPTSSGVGRVCAPAALAAVLMGASVVLAC